MTQWTNYRLVPKPGAGFHFGLRGLEQEESAPYCPSDTLFAALVATLADLEGDAGVRAFVAPFEAGNPPFLLSSAFPQVGDLPLLPFPFLRVELALKRGRRKLLKQLRYVSPAIFRRLLARQSMENYVDGVADEGTFLQGGQVWLAREELDALPQAWRKLAPEDVRRRGAWRAWLKDEVGRRWLREQRVWGAAPVDRVTVDRVTAASAIYRIGRTVYAPGCGLWFGVQWPTGVDPAARAQLERLLLHLGDRGLGGERSVGYGQFEGRAVPTPLDLPGPSAIGPCLTLSRYLPRRSELPQALRGEAAYRLDGIAGWLGAPGQPAQRRRQVHMLREGSVFEAVGEAPYGCLADVRPQGWDAHPIWRYGYACHVGLES